MSISPFAIGERERGPAPRRPGGADRLAERFLRARRVPEVAFEIGDLGPRHLVGVDILRPELDTGAEIGVHGALAVRRDMDQAARGGQALGRRRRGEVDAERADIMREDLA
jgi:hypothetical protein